MELYVCRGFGRVIYWQLASKDKLELVTSVRHVHELAQEDAFLNQPSMTKPHIIYTNSEMQELWPVLTN